MLAGTATAGTLAPGIADGAAVASPASPPDVVETDTQIIVDNGPVRLTVDKSNGRATSIEFGGVDLVGNGGRGNYDMNNVREGPAGQLPPRDDTYAIRTGDDFVDVVFRYSPTGDGPFWLERHHILRSGEPGIHLATTFDHTTELHGFRSDQHRYVFYLNYELFTHVWVGDDPIGERWRDAAARMPTPAELSAAPTVMDVTYDLDGLGSAYPRRYYTKYDWSVYMKDHVLHGLYGNGYGIWAVLPNKETFSGGPVRQDLTLHQTESRPVLLVEPHATHYGSPPVRIAAGAEWRKTYGPYFVYFAQGDDPARMREQARRYANFDAHASCYDRLALPGWTASDERATVSGTVRIPGVSSMRGAVAVLSDNRLDFQRTVLGHAYWTDVGADGRFRLPDVRPGRYRLTVYKSGVWGEYVQDDVVVPDGGVVRLGGLRLGGLRWTPDQHGRTVFELGTPNRTSVDFHNGTAFRQYGLFERFHDDFPDGVVYTVGRSTNADWNYVQYQRAGRATAPDGSITPDGVLLFDFGSASSPVAAGYHQVTNATLYDAQRGYGLDREVDVRDRGAPDDLRADFTFADGYAFLADLPDGDYEVTVVSGDDIAANDSSVAVQDGEPVSLAAAAGEYAVHRTELALTGGRLRCWFTGTGRANAVQVRQLDVPMSLLTDLGVDGWPLAPAFSPYRSGYVLDVPHHLTELPIRATATDGARVTVDGVPVPSGEPCVVTLDTPRTEIEIGVAHPAAAEPATYRLHAVKQERPWRIRFDLNQAPPAGATATLTVALAAWAVGSAIPVPDEESNLTVKVNERSYTWTFQPDDARGATYRSACGGRTYRREFRFDASLLRRHGNEIVLEINAGKPHLATETAYDAIRLEIATTSAS